jgi:hypothetical protein
MGSDENQERNEQIDRVIRESEARVIHEDSKNEILNEAVDSINATLDTTELVDMSFLITYLSLNGVTSTYYGGGSKYGNFVSRPYILFPFLEELPVALKVLESLARSTQNEEILSALFSPVSESEVGRGESLLHGEKEGFITKGGRVISFDNTWGIDLESVSYDDIWAPGLRKHGIEPPPSSGELAWRFAIYFPVQHANELSNAAQGLI